jgi:uncharacterized protein (DUF2132 family)
MITKSNLNPSTIPPSHLASGQDCLILRTMEKGKDKPEIDSQPNNPLHGVKLADILEYLVEKYGWENLGDRINIRCFTHDPSISSSLKFLRKTDWARTKVEELYLKTKRRDS